MKLLATVVIAVALTGCSSFSESIIQPISDVANSALQEPTVKSGMTSRDAAYATNYKKYIEGATKDRPIIEIEGTGAPITVTGVKSIKVYNTSSATVAAPVQPKSAIVELIDSTGNLLAKVLLPWTAITQAADLAREANANATAVRQTELGITAATVESNQSTTSEVIQSYEPVIVR